MRLLGALTVVNLLHTKECMQERFLMLDSALVTAAVVHNGTVVGEDVGFCFDSTAFICDWQVRLVPSLPLACTLFDALPILPFGCCVCCYHLDALSTIIIWMLWQE